MIVVTVSDDRRKRLLEEMAGEGIDVLLLYGNAWQNDYLRYATDFGILEGQALAVVREDGVTLYLDSPLEADRAAREVPGVEVVHAPDLLDRVDNALSRLSNRRIGTAPARLIPRKLAAHAKDLNLSDRTAYLDRLLMGKLPAEVDAIRRACKVADEGYRVFMNAAQPGRADYELIAETEAFFRSRGVDDNFQIIGVGGPEVRGMAPPSGKRLKRGDMVTTELTPCVDGYYAQICRTLVVGEPNAEQNKAFALYREADGGRHRLRARRHYSGRHRAGQNDMFRREGLGDYVTDQYTRGAWPRGRVVRRHQAAHSRRRHDAHRRRHDLDRAPQHLSPGGRLPGAG